MLYSSPQLRLLLALGATLLVGFAVSEWRAGFPDAAGRLERFDSEEPAAALLPSPAPAPSPGVLRPKSAPPPPGAAAPDPGPLDLNRAGVEELARLPGVGPGLARRIVEERERRGRFDSPDALRDILGLGPRKLAALRHLVTVND